MAICLQIEKDCWKTDFSEQLKRIICRYKKIGYNTNVKRQIVFMVVSPIMPLVPLLLFMVCWDVSLLKMTKRILTIARENLY